MKNKYGLNSIAVIVCYIGRFPDWFPLWLESCKKNETIDFYVFTDQMLQEIPNNVKIIPITLKQLKYRFSKFLKFECSLEMPYKLCDYRAIFGAVFQEYIQEYDFWGHCDVDMVFGDLRKFITENVLNSFDRIFEVGHLCLYRNYDAINNLYREVGALFPYKKVFKEKHYCGFDEHTGMTRICEVNQIPTYKKVVCADIDPHYKAFYMMDEDSTDGEMAVKNYNYQVFTWENGKTWQAYIDDKGNMQKKEVSYIHFMRKYPINAEMCIGQEKYCITYKEFVPIHEKITVSFIKKYSHTVTGIAKGLEYSYNFAKNGWRAWKKDELALRFILRFQRIKAINRKHCKKQLDSVNEIEVKQPNLLDNLRRNLKSSLAIRLACYPVMSIKKKFDTVQYQYSNEAKKIQRYKGKHLGQRCFIIGNGPSLRADDLILLKKEVTIAGNRIYNIFPQTEWRPTYYFCIDNDGVKECIAHVNHLSSTDCFFALSAKRYLMPNANPDNITLLNYAGDKFIINRYNDRGSHISEDISKYVSCGYTVLFAAIQFAIYSGIKEIFLIGVDFDYSIIVDRWGRKHLQKNVQDYFDKKTYKGSALNYESTLFAYMQARKYCDEHGIKIFNATRGGKLEVFERVDFDSVIGGTENKD